MISDFRGYLEGEVEDRAYWVSAAFESSYEKYSGWRKEGLIEDTVWALMLGFELKLCAWGGNLMMNTEEAVDTLSPLVKKRMRAISEQRTARDNSQFHPYTLFLGGSESAVLTLDS